MEQGQRNFRRRISVARANTIQVDENDEIPEFKNFKDLRRETLFATSTAMIKRSNAVNKIKEQEEEVKVITPYTKLEKCFRQCKEISLAYQISFYLILSTFTISALIVLLSTVNLSWLREWQIEIASDLLVDSVDRQIIDYAEQIGNEYSNRLQILDRRGGSVPTESTDIPLYWHNQIPDSVLDYAPAFPTTPVTYDFPALYTPHSTISDEGIDIFDSLRVINILIPQLFHGSFMYMYLGFPFDDLYFQYPGMPLPPGYFAISRSWMLGAIESEGEVYMTEPYQDTFSGGWMVSVTKAVYNKDGTLRYVAGVDFYLKFLFEAIGKVKILDDGFAAIIANGGLIVSEVDDDIWSSEEGILSRVFADEMTGIDIYDYIEMRDQDIVIDATWSFETPSGKEAYH